MEVDTESPEGAALASVKQPELPSLLYPMSAKSCSLGAPLLHTPNQ